MHPPDSQSDQVRISQGRTVRLGCVSYLNARPLIEGLEDAVDPADGASIQVKYNVPSRLLADLEAGLLDIALCPVIDFYSARVPLEIVPVGGIGCHGSTLTVRLCSRVPIKRISTVYADTDSHTSVILLQVVLAERFGLRPRMIAYDAREHTAGHRLAKDPESLLLIGDKVVNAPVDDTTYVHQIDLGQAWHDLTGLPFVFALWMARRGALLGQVPAILDQLRIRNSHRIDWIIQRHAQTHGWPTDLARHYLAQLLDFQLGSLQLEAINTFAKKAHRLGLIEHDQPLVVRETPDRSGGGSPRVDALDRR